MLFGRGGMEEILMRGMRSFPCILSMSYFSLCCSLNAWNCGFLSLGDILIWVRLGGGDQEITQIWHRENGGCVYLTAFLLFPDLQDWLIYLLCTRGLDGGWLEWVAVEGRKMYEALVALAWFWSRLQSMRIEREPVSFLYVSILSGKHVCHCPHYMWLDSVPTSSRRLWIISFSSVYPLHLMKSGKHRYSAPI